MLSELSTTRNGGNVHSSGRLSFRVRALPADHALAFAFCHSIRDRILGNVEVVRATITMFLRAYGDYQG